jgi:TolB-like protein
VARGRTPPFSAYRGDEPYVFVSYAHADADWVYGELEWLRDQGLHLWYDEGIEPGRDWPEELARAIEGCAAFLLCVSPHSVVSRQVVNEVHFALDAGRPLLAAHFEDVGLPAGLRLRLASVQAVLRGDLGEAGFRRKLLGALADLLGRSVPEVPVDVDVSRPVPGFGDRQAVVVLPFRNLSGGSDTDYFAAGLTEELIVGLQSWKTLPVVSRASTTAYAGDDVDVRRLARELGVGYAIQASVRQSGGRVRITARLIDARSGVQLFAERFEGGEADLFELQDRLVQQIMGAIEPELLRSEKERSRRVPTEDMAAWDLYLRGQAEFDRADYEGFLGARQFWRRALEKDPALPHALAGLAGVEYYLLLHHRGRLSDDEAAAARERGFRLAKEAARIDPQYLPGQMALSAYLIHAGEYARAVEVAAHGVELCPGSSQSHRCLGFALFRAGRFDAALAEYAIAKRLSPNDPMLWEILTQESACHFFSSRYEETVRLARRAIEMNPRVVWPHLFCAMSLGALGRKQEADAALARFLEDVPDFSAEQLAEIDPVLAEPFVKGLRELGWSG